MKSVSVSVSVSLPFSLSSCCCLGFGFGFGFHFHFAFPFAICFPPRPLTIFMVRRLCCVLFARPGEGRRYGLLGALFGLHGCTWGGALDLLSCINRNGNAIMSQAAQSERPTKGRGESSNALARRQRTAGTGIPAVGMCRVSSAFNSIASQVVRRHREVATGQGGTS